MGRHILSGKLRIFLGGSVLNDVLRNVDRPKIFLANYDIDLGGTPAFSRGVLISEKKMKSRKMKR